MNFNKTEAGALTVNEFCDWARIGRAKFYEEVRTGKIKMHKIGRKSLIKTADAQAWLDALPEAA